MNKKTIGIFSGCVSCSKHCCLLRSERNNMCLHISGKEYELIITLTGKTNNFTTLNDGRIVININEDGFCPFVDKLGCTLGEYRPLPCKYYPYGIMLKNGIYYLIRWTNVCESFLDSNDQEEYDCLYRLIYPGLEKRAFVYNKNDKGKFIIIQQVPEIFLNEKYFANAS